MTNKLKVLIIGCCGFIGTWLSEFMQLKSINIYGIDKSVNNSLYNAVKPIKQKNFYKFDVKDKEKLEKVVNQVNPDVIIYLAAQPIVSVGYEEPYETFLENTIGILNTLEILRKNSKKGLLICITSDKCYKEKGMYELKETDSLGFSDPYSTSKAIQELLCGAYGKLFTADKQGIITLRLGNVIGGGDLSKNRLVPDIMKHIFKKEEIQLRNPSAIRSWQYVLDLVNCIWKLILKSLITGNKKVYNSFNLAGFKDCKLIKVNDLFELLSNENSIDFYNGNKFYYENQALLLDTEKIVGFIGEYRNYDLNRALNETKEVYRLLFTQTDNKKIKGQIDKIIGGILQ